MDIKVYHSSSASNLYSVDDLLLEAGAPIRKIKEALNFRLTDIRACLVSHSHLDHGRSAMDLMRSGVEVYCSEGTSEALGLSGHRLHILEPLQQVQIGPWKVLPFPLAHDCEGTMGFFLVKEDERLLFAVDGNYVPYTARAIVDIMHDVDKSIVLTNIMLGVNYSLDILRENVRAGRIVPALANRILKNHLSLNTALDFFRANDLSQVQEIFLLHLSNANSDGADFKRQVEMVTGRPVTDTRG